MEKRQSAVSCEANLSRQFFISLVNRGRDIRAESSDVTDNATTPFPFSVDWTWTTLSSTNTLV